MKLPEGIEVRVGWPWWLRPFVLRGVAAITIGRRIFLARALPDAELEPLLRHELVHVRQARERGIVNFFARYAVEYAAARLRGMTHDAAYRSISFEREAFTAEAGGVELRASIPQR